MPRRDPTKPAGYYCDGPRHKEDCPDRVACPGCLPPCSQRAGWATSHPGSGKCKRHGGSTGAHLAAAAKERVRREREEARAACDRLNLPVATRDPGEVLLGEIVRTQRVIYWRETEQALADATSDIELSERHAAALLDERKHLRGVAGEAIRANVARRAIELAEDQARQVVMVLERYTEALGLDRSSPLVREAGRAALLLIAGGGQ